MNAKCRNCPHDHLSPLSSLLSLPKTTLADHLIASSGRPGPSASSGTPSRAGPPDRLLRHAVEGIHIQTHAVLRRAWTERLRPEKYLSDVDSLLAGPTQDSAFADVEEEGDDEDAFRPEKGNVAFACALDGWGFRVGQFAEFTPESEGDGGALHGDGAPLLLVEVVHEAEAPGELRVEDAAAGGGDQVVGEGHLGGEGRDPLRRPLLPSRPPPPPLLLLPPPPHPPPPPRHSPALPHPPPRCPLPRPQPHH